MSDYWPEEALALPLFQPPARRTDPKPSHAAAAKVPAFRGKHATRILDALAAGPAGQSEIARRTGMTVAAVSKRLPELRRVGAIEVDGDCPSASGGRETRYRRAKA